MAAKAVASHDACNHLIHLHQSLGGAGAHVCVDERWQQGGVVRHLAVPVLEETVEDGRVERLRQTGNTPPLVN